MATPSKRGKILKNILRQLETITVANGYSQTVNKVTMNVKGWQDTPAAETPVIYVVDESTKLKYNPGKLIENEWTVGIYCVMKDKTQIEMEDHIADVVECLFKNVTLSFDGEVPGPISHLRVLDIVTDNQLFSEIEGSQLFKITINFLYTSCVGQR